MTLLAPQSMFLTLASLGNVAKSSSWALWGATHTYFIKHFALANNVGDLTAKSDAQGAFAQISGWFAGIIAISYSHSAPFLFTFYFLLAPLHVIATWNLLHAAEFRLLNEACAKVMIQHYLQHNRPPTNAYLDANTKFFREAVKDDSRFPKIDLGASLDVFESKEELLSAFLVTGVGDVGIK